MIVWISTTIKIGLFVTLQGRGGTLNLRNKRMNGAEERIPTPGGVLMDFVENAQRLLHFSV
jgi:hypothetical protein